MKPIYRGKFGEYLPGEIPGYEKELKKLPLFESEIESLGYGLVGDLWIDFEGVDEDELFEQRVGQIFPGTFRVFQGHQTYVFAGAVDDARKSGLTLRPTSFFAIVLYSELKNGSYLITAKHPYLLPLAGLGRREAHPELSVSALHQKHQDRLQWFGPAKNLKGDLKSVAKSVEDYAARTIKADHGELTSIPADWADLFSELRTFLAESQKQGFSAEHLGPFEELKKKFQPAEMRLELWELQDYLKATHSFFQLKADRLRDAFENYSRLTFKPGASQGGDFGLELLQAVLQKNEFGYSGSSELTGALTVEREKALSSFSQSLETGYWTKAGFHWFSQEERNGEVWESHFCLRAKEEGFEVELLCQLPLQETQACRKALNDPAQSLEPLVNLLGRCLNENFQRIAYWCCWRYLQQNSTHQGATQVIQGLQSQGLNLSEVELMEVGARVAPIFPARRALHGFHFVDILERARVQGEDAEPEAATGFSSLISKFSLGSRK